MASFVTFYSYKGGAGRTLALANVAVLLAQWGQRVLCVDWDLEAPGLHHYFRAHLDHVPRTGLLDLAEALAAQKSVSPKRFVTKSKIANLDLVCAGSLETPPEWSVWYRHGFGEALETVRDAWGASYDFVLVDSRTGITDAGGICTVQMPDLLVLLTTASEQGLEGTFDVAQRALAARKKLAFDRAALQILPVLARFDQRVESAIASSYLKRFAERVTPLCRAWLPESVPSIEIAKLTKIPYVPHLSFGEKLPVLEEGTADPESVGYALETIAALLARRLSDADLLVRNRDAYVAAAQSASAAKRAREGEFSFDVFFVSRVPTSIGKLLEKRGLRVFDGSTSRRPDGGSVDALDSGESRESNLRGARALVIVRDGALSGAEIEDAASFLKSGDRATQRLVIVGDGEPLPSLLRDALVMRGDDHAIADRLTSLLRTEPREGDPLRGAFGAESTRGGRALSATFDADYRVTLRVQKTARGLPLSGAVRFHLHPMLPNPVRDVPVKDGVAELTVTAPMAFTVGAEADGGATPLEIDLARAKEKA